jgi:hypothetical protein
MAENRYQLQETQTPLRTRRWAIVDTYRDGAEIMTASEHQPRSQDAYVSLVNLTALMNEHERLYPVIIAQPQPQG